LCFTFYKSSSVEITTAGVASLFKHISEAAAKIALDAVGVVNLARMVDALLASETLAIGQDMQSQVSALSSILSANTKGSLPAEVLASIEKVKTSGPEKKIFSAIKALAQGDAIIVAAGSAAEKRAASVGALGNLSKLKDDVNKMLESGVALEESVQSIKGFFDTKAKLEEQLHGKPEAAHLAILWESLQTLLRMAIAHHLDSEVGPLLKSACIHQEARDSLPKLPAWSIRLLQDVSSHNGYCHVVFRQGLLPSLSLLFGCCTSIRSYHDMLALGPHIIVKFWCD
jgi:hypothetical protein